MKKQNEQVQYLVGRLGARTVHTQEDFDRLKSKIIGSKIISVTDMNRDLAHARFGLYPKDGLPMVIALDSGVEITALEDNNSDDSGVMYFYDPETRDQTADWHFGRDEDDWEEAECYAAGASERKAKRIEENKLKTAKVVAENEKLLKKVRQLEKSVKELEEDRREQWREFLTMSEEVRTLYKQYQRTLEWMLASDKSPTAPQTELQQHN